jgi:small conductance mechanosensitive channel
VQRRLVLVIAVPLLILAGLAILTGIVLQAADIDVIGLVESAVGESELTAGLDQVLGLLCFPFSLISIAFAFLVAFMVSRVSDRLAGWVLSTAHIASDSANRLTATSLQQPENVSSRRVTTQQLVASLISFTAFTLATIFALGQFVSLTNLALLATVLANAFGFAARDYVGDLLNGLSNLFEDRFDVGDNIEIVRVEDEIRGIVEQVNIRTMALRTRSGELVIVPQGQVRILRNYTRGAFTGTDVTVSVAATDLVAAMQILSDLALEAPNLLEDLLEPWRVISREGQVNSESQLVIYAKGAYGRGAQLRLEIMALVQQRLAQAGIELAG